MPHLPPSSLPIKLQSSSPVPWQWPFLNLLSQLHHHFFLAVVLLPSMYHQQELKKNPETQPRDHLPPAELHALDQQQRPCPLQQIHQHERQENIPANDRRVADQPNLQPTMIFNVLEDVINNFIDPPLRPSVDPRYVLSDNFAPVDELPPTECEVIHGSLPSCLDGAYIRNGPNPQFLPRGPYHLFDGDGMLHSVRISQGKATLCSRYIKTYKYTLERDAGAPLLPNVFSGFNGLAASAARGALSAFRILAGQFNPANGIGLANTSLAYFGNRLYALGESDLPYAVRFDIKWRHRDAGSSGF
ncbi:hypothetical protein OIU84_006474 [Salix udensis]|uniref:Carotenoid cleavage dioxygenase 4 n=1 Tax=Salix udensis TaxID=889485 RepID=A0AAD6JYN2_9ROSI|nr:hypothetical protein OIU84_006474 [Salix udensis]